MERNEKAKKGRLTLRTAAAALIALAVCIGLVFAGYALRNVYRYENALSLLRGAKYSQAAEAFEALGSYRDAASYALYSRSADAGESGRYLSAAGNLQSLNGFADSAVLSLYYTARNYEEIGAFEEARPIYTRISLYRDSSERLASLPEKILERDYSSARALEDKGQTEKAISAYQALGDYRDSAGRAEALKNALTENKNAEAYARAEALFEAGRFSAAQTAFLALGDYRDSAQRAAEAQEKFLAGSYAEAERAEAAGDAVAAWEGFTALGDYRDSAERAEALREERAYQSAWKEVLRGNFASALSLYASLGDYRDSAAKAGVLSVCANAETRVLGPGLASFRLGESMGLVNLNTGRITAASYDSIGSFDALGPVSLAKVSVGGLYGFIDPDGIERIPPVYAYAGSFDENGLCQVRSVTGLYGYIGRDGGEAVPCEYAALSPFSGGVCAAVKDRRLGLLNARGEVLVPFVFRGLGGVTPDSRSLTVPVFDENGLMTVRDDTGGYTLMDREYRILGDDTWDEIDIFREGLARVRSGRYYGFVDTENQIAIPPEWPEADRFSEGLCAVRDRRGQIGYIDKTGELVIPAVYSEAGRFSGGSARVMMDGIGWYMIDPKGENTLFTVIPYEQAAKAQEEGDYETAALGFEALGDYGDAHERMLESVYLRALELREEGKPEEALALAEYLVRTGEYPKSDALAGAIRADLLFDSGKTAEAWDLYSRADEELRRHNEDYARMYAEAESLLEAGSYDEAIAAFRALGAYSDSADRIDQAYDGKYRTEYDAALRLMEEGKYDEAISGFSALGDYSRAQDMALECRYLKALETEKDGGRRAALAEMLALGDYNDAPSQALRMQADMLYDAGDLGGAWEIYETLDDGLRTHGGDYQSLYQAADALFLESRFDEAETAFTALGGYSDSADRAEDCREGRRAASYAAAAALLEDKKYDDAADAFAALGAYGDSPDMVKEAVYRKAADDGESKRWTEAAAGFWSLLEDGDGVIRRITGLPASQQRDIICAQPCYKDAGAQYCRICAEQLFDSGSYAVAWEVFSGLDDSLRTRDGEYEILYARAEERLSGGEFDEAEAAFAALGAYRDSASRVEDCREGRRNAAYLAASDLLGEGKYDLAAAAFAALGDYRDSREMATESVYQKALALDAAGSRSEAMTMLTAMMDAPDDAEALILNDAGLDPREVSGRLLAMPGYKDTPSHLCRMIADGVFDRGDYAAAWSVYGGLDAVYHTHDADYLAFYEAADKRLKNGDYAGAEQAFLALGEYRDSPARASEAFLAGQEDVYTRATALQENGEYDAAYDLYASLDGYSDSEEKLLEVAQQKADSLYEAGRFSEAAEVYRLLGSEKESDALWHEAERLRLSGEYPAAGAQWMAIADYADSRERNYQMGVERAAAGDSMTAVVVFALDPDYRDAREQIYRIGTLAHDAKDYRTSTAAWEALGAYKDSGMNLTMDTYALGGQLFEEGRFDEAASVYISMNGFSNTADLALESSYQAALAVLESGDYGNAEERFTALGGYRDSRTMVLEARYRMASAAMEGGEYETALALFEKLGTSGYRDSRTQAQAARYAIADGQYLAGDYAAAAAGFEAIPGYRDADTRWRQARHMGLSALLDEGKYDEAIAGFEKLAEEGYVPSVSEVSRSHYLKARSLDASGRTEDAYREYEAAGQYQDAPALAKERAYILACGLRDAGDYPAAVAWYETADDHGDAREQLYLIGEHYFSLQDWPNAVNACKTLAGYRDASQLLCRIGQYYDMQSDPMNAYLAYGFAGEDSDGATRAEALRKELLSRAQTAAKTGKTADAIRIYETMARVDPDIYRLLLQADIVDFIARPGQVLYIGNTAWRFLKTDSDGSLLFVSEAVLANITYDNSSSWLSRAKTDYFTPREQPLVRKLWIMTRDETERYLPNASDRKTGGSGSVWTSTKDTWYSYSSSTYYYTYSASSGSMSGDSVRSGNSAGVRPALKLSPEIAGLILDDPNQYTVLQNGRRVAYDSGYMADYSAALEANRLKRYRRALALMESGKYTDASQVFTELGDYRESARMIRECAYQQALLLAESGEDEKAIAAFKALDGYSDSIKQIELAEERIRAKRYAEALALAESGEDEKAIAAFEALDGYGDSAKQIELAKERIRAKRYAEAENLEAEGRYEEAFAVFSDADMAAFRDSPDRAAMVAEKAAEQERARPYAEAAALFDAGNYEAALEIYTGLGDYKDSPEKSEDVREAVRARDYDAAVKALAGEDYTEALRLLETLGDYRDSAVLLSETTSMLDQQYQTALSHALSGNLSTAYGEFSALGDYRDSAKKAEIVGNLSRAGKTVKLADGVLIYEFHALWGIANLNTNIITPVKYTEITFEKGSRYAAYGLAKVFISGGKRSTSYSSSYSYINALDTYGYIDMNGAEVVPCSYLFLTDFDASGRCTVGKNAMDTSYSGYYTRVLFGIVDHTGRVVTAAQWRTMGNSGNQKWSNYNSASDWRTSYFSVDLPAFTSGRMKVQNKDGLWGYISEQGAVLGQIKWSSVGNFSDGMAMVSESQKSGTGYYSNYVTRYGFINEQGQTVGQVRWDEVRNFSQGLAAVRENDRWGFIDRTNTLVIPCRYAEVNAFKADGTCDVRNPDGTWIVIDREGNSAFFGK